jgi:hypothetical protein
LDAEGCKKFADELEESAEHDRVGGFDEKCTPRSTK